ncbi:MAG TPA: response regulator [Aggregatilineaceae bacterium]|nr:response regulator [Aggregatilineaceae bacterium]
MISKVVMVVDDESEMLALLEIMLRRYGLAVMKAPDADLALHLVKSLKPDLFMLDVMMPGMNGFDLCRELRATPHTAKTPVIMFSALDTPQSRKKAIECGADVFISKRTLSDELSGQIHALLGNHTKDHWSWPG